MKFNQKILVFSSLNSALEPLINKHFVPDKTMFNTYYYELLPLINHAKIYTVVEIITRNLKSGTLLHLYVAKKGYYDMHITCKHTGISNFYTYQGYINTNKIGKMPHVGFIMVE